MNAGEHLRLVRGAGKADRLYCYGPRHPAAPCIRRRLAVKLAPTEATHHVSAPTNLLRTRLRPLCGFRRVSTRRLGPVAVCPLLVTASPTADGREMLMLASVSLVLDTRVSSGAGCTAGSAGQSVFRDTGPQPSECDSSRQGSRCWFIRRPRRRQRRNSQSQRRTSAL